MSKIENEPGPSMMTRMTRTDVKNHCALNHLFPMGRRFRARPLIGGQYRIEIGDVQRSMSNPSLARPLAKFAGNAGVRSKTPPLRLRWLRS